MTIGDFSRATRLSAKALRHYHRLGLLEPVEVDPFTGYRSYGVEQVDDAHLIRRFRSLDMPLDVIGQVLAVDRPEDRTELIAEHLRRMEQRLAETRDAVTALRSLLESDHVSAVVERRWVEETPRARDPRPHRPVRSRAVVHHRAGRPRPRPDGDRVHLSRAVGGPVVDRAVPRRVGRRCPLPPGRAPSRRAPSTDRAGRSGAVRGATRDDARCRHALRPRRDDRAGPRRPRPTRRPARGQRRGPDTRVVRRRGARWRRRHRDRLADPGLSAERHAGLDASRTGRAG
nr:helix-turn-helix domain-containing protein [Aeromicrobium stalagmiti]